MWCLSSLQKMIQLTWWQSNLAFGFFSSSSYGFSWAPMTNGQIYPLYMQTDSPTSTLGGFSRVVDELRIQKSTT